MISRARILLIIIGLIVLGTEHTFCQCACCSGAAVGGITPVSAKANVGVLKPNFLKTSVYYMNSYGDSYYRGDKEIINLYDDYYVTNYLGLNLGYGLFRDFTIEAELGYFLEKKQKQLGADAVVSRGPSHITLSGKYNLYDSRSKEIEITVGGGAKIPFDENEALPQHLKPSAGAYGAVLQAFFHKGFIRSGWSFLYYSRAEFNAENGDDYKYGDSFINSFFIIRNIVENLNAGLELRGDYRKKDYDDGDRLDDTGGFSLICSPILSYQYESLNLSASYNYPVYKYYFGKQLTNDYSFSLILDWSLNLLQ